MDALKDPEMMKRVAQQASGKVPGLGSWNAADLQASAETVKGYMDPEQMSKASEMMKDPQAMKSFMDNPMVKNMLEDPEMLSAMMEQNPQTKAMLDANPEMRAMLTDPAMVKMSMEHAMNNPDMMKEIMKQAGQ